MRINEVSNKLLGDYKKRAGADATASDKRGDYERGNKRFRGIVKATKKEFDNDLKRHKAVDESEDSLSIPEGEITEEMIAAKLKKDLEIFKRGQKKDSELSKKPRDREIQAKVTEISDQTIKNYAKGVEADSRKHKMDPTKRSAEKRNRSVSGFAKAMNRLDKKAK
jgi:hypothetical protein